MPWPEHCHSKELSRGMLHAGPGPVLRRAKRGSCRLISWGWAELSASRAEDECGYDQKDSRLEALWANKLRNLTVITNTHLSFVTIIIMTGLFRSKTVKKVLTFAFTAQVLSSRYRAAMIMKCNCIIGICHKLAWDVDSKSYYSSQTYPWFIF